MAVARLRAYTTPCRGSLYHLAPYYCIVHPGRLAVLWLYAHHDGFKHRGLGSSSCLLVFLLKG